MFLRRVPLVWHNLTHNGRRLLVAVCGIGFAVVLMFTEVGFRNALFDSTVQIFEKLRADLLLTSKAHYALLSCETFSHRRIYQARACPGVQRVCPLYVQIFGPVWKSPVHTSHPIRVLGCEPGDPIFDIPAVAACRAALRQEGTALFDTKSKAKYGLPEPPAAIVAQRGAELSGQAVRLVGTFELGADFVSDGTLIVSTDNFAKYCAGRAAGEDPLGIVDLGIVQVAPGADVADVQRQLRELLPDDVLVLTKQELIDRERRFWSESTPIGYVFSLGVMIGFLVGVIICYQIIYADVSDHIPEFATLKAMGYPNRYFIALVLREALLLSVMSFLPGLAVSLGLYWVLARWTGLLMLLTVPRAAVVFLLTAVMCIVSGCLAMRRVLSADPAALF